MAFATSSAIPKRVSGMAVIASQTHGAPTNVLLSRLEMDTATLSAIHLSATLMEETARDIALQNVGTGMSVMEFVKKRVKSQLVSVTTEIAEIKTTGNA
jgi:hypothetical protein